MRSMNISTTCYVCSQRRVKKAFDKLGWTILRCSACGLYSLKFEGSYEKFIKEYYNKKFFTGSNERAGYFDYEGDKEAERRNMNSYLEGIRSSVKKGTLLDVGCATGLFMIEAEKAGFEVYGVDVSKYAIDIAKKRFKNKVKQSSIEQAHFKKNTFDVITLFDVIEHVSKPRTVLKKLRSLLMDNGLLVINTGDTGSLFAKMQGSYWHFFIPPQHFFYFSKSTLSKLLSQEGFEVLRVEHKGKWVSLRYLFHLARQIQNDIFGKIGFSLVGNNAIGKIPVYLNLFDNMTVYAKKTNT